VAGKDDLRLLSAFIHSKTKGIKSPDDDIHAIGAVVMNRAISLGSMMDAIQSMNPTPDVIETLSGNIPGRSKKEYKRVIQLTSKMLRGSVDPTGGAVEVQPRRAKIDKSLGLIKTHATKNHNFYKPSNQLKPTGGM
jgi:hypothetical protein